MITFKVDDLSEMNAELRAFSEFLRGSSICDDDIFASRLVSCELLTNVIRHSGETAEFKGELFSDRIAITVTSKNMGGVNIHAGVPDVFAESGRGLYIVRCFGEIEQSSEGLTVCIKLHNK